MTNRLEKIVFKLKRDSSGYPPLSHEGIWAKKVGESLYEIDNIPFFVFDVAVGDVVRVEVVDGELRFTEVVTRSRNSTLRFFAKSEESVARIRSELLLLGGDSEGSHISKLVSVNVSSNDLDKVLTKLQKLEEMQELEFEEAAIRRP